MMKVRKLQQAEHQRVKALYEEVFSEDSKAFVEYYFQEKTTDNQIYVIEEDLITAMIHLNPYEMMVNGQSITAHYIVAVATKEPYRGQGYMATLLRQVLKDMHRNKEAFTFLMPAAEGIYLPYDFRTVYEQKRRYYSEGAHGEEGFGKATDHDVEELVKYANVHLQRNYHVYTKRSESYYRRLLKEYEADNACLMVKKEKNKIVDCRHCMPHTGEHAAKIMIRIVALEQMLMLLKLKRLTVLCFQVTDPIMEENNKCVVLTGTEFSGVMVMEGDTKNSEGILSIAVLGEIIFGHITVAEAAEIKGIEMSDRMKEELEKLIPLSKLYINETV